MAFTRGVKEAPDAALRPRSPGGCHPSRPERERALWIYATSVRRACDPCGRTGPALRSPRPRLGLMFCCRRFEILNRFLAMAPPHFHSALGPSSRRARPIHNLWPGIQLGRNKYWLLYYAANVPFQTTFDVPCKLGEGASSVPNVQKSGETYDLAHRHSASSRVS